MFFIFNPVFWDKFDYYQQKGMSLRESYLRARWQANLSIDYHFYTEPNGGYKFK